MKGRYKKYLKLNLVSLIFIVISFISLAFAWFAYSGLLKVGTEVNVKAWYIELENRGSVVTNAITVDLADIYPGMKPVQEIVKIKNLGDSDASVKYSIASARILDENNYTIDDITTSSYVEDLLAHNFPFHVNISLSKNYALSKGEDSFFEVSISWPLDSEDNNLDSLWGNKAYTFHKNEEQLKKDDPGYKTRSSIQIVINLAAEQYLDVGDESDPKYNLGDTVLFDPVANNVCTTVEATNDCLITYVIDANNKLGDDTVTLLPNPLSTYLSGSYNAYDSLFTSLTTNWTVPKRHLLVSDILKPISGDIMKSVLVREDMSDRIIGNLNYGNRIDTEISRAITYNGYYQFLNEKYGFLAANDCYWTNSEYGSEEDINTQAFAVRKIDSLTSKIYGNLKSEDCKIIPVIIASKDNLE